MLDYIHRLRAAEERKREVEVGSPEFITAAMDAEELSRMALRRFAAGGSGIVLRWQGLLVSALAMLPLVALLAVVLTAPPAARASSAVHSWPPA